MVERAARAQDGISIKGVVDFTISTPEQPPHPDRLDNARKHTAGTETQNSKKKVKPSRTMKHKR